MDPVVVTVLTLLTSSGVLGLVYKIAQLALVWRVYEGGDAEDAARIALALKGRAHPELGRADAGPPDGDEGTVSEGEGQETAEDPGAGAGSPAAGRGRGSRKRGRRRRGGPRAGDHV